jgi:hypothetical protein
MGTLALDFRARPWPERCIEQRIPDGDRDHHRLAEHGRSLSPATIAQEFAEHKEADVVYGDYTWIDEKGSVIRIRREIEFNRFILCYHRVLYIPTPSSFLPPEYLRKAIGSIPGFITRWIMSFS